jgi:ATP-dependent protease ClpP protease subunit
MMKFEFKQQMERPDTLELYIYSEVIPDSYNWWTDETEESETSANFFRKKLAEYKDVKYINLYINSEGGYVKEGYGIYAQLKRHTAVKTVYIDGFANSVASIIAMCGDKIIMCVNSVMGIHNMMGWCFGNAAEHRQVADNLDSMMEGNRQLYLERANGKITLEKLIELLDKETTLTATECLQYGFCDEIAETVSNPEAVKQSLKNLNETMEAQIKYFQSLKQTFHEAMQLAKPAVQEPQQQNTSEPLETGGIEPQQTTEADPPPPTEPKVSDFLMQMFKS